MASVLLSEAEKTFICHGVEDNLRADGQGRGDMRPLVLETGVVSHASVSCHLRLANTDILVGVKTELETPDPAAPDRGRVEFFVDCSANATPSFEGRGGESLATSISGVLSRAYRSVTLCTCTLSTYCILQCPTKIIIEFGYCIYHKVTLHLQQWRGAGPGQPAGAGKTHRLGSLR